MIFIMFSNIHSLPNGVITTFIGPFSMTHFHNLSLQYILLYRVAQK